MDAGPQIVFGLSWCHCFPSIWNCFPSIWMRQIWTLGPRLFLTHDLQLRFFENLRLCQLLSGLHPDQPFINGCSNEAIDVRLNLPDGIALAVQYDYFVANKFHGCVPLEKSPPGRARRRSLQGGSFRLAHPCTPGGVKELRISPLPHGRGTVTAC